MKKDLIVVVGKGKGIKFDPVLGQAVQEVLRNNCGVHSTVDPNHAGRIIVAVFEEVFLDTFLSVRKLHIFMTAGTTINHLWIVEQYSQQWRTVGTRRVSRSQPHLPLLTSKLFFSQV